MRRLLNPIAGRPASPKKRHNNRDRRRAASDRAQLAQLARGLSEKATGEIRSIEKQNPDLIDEWLEAFRQEEDKTKSEAAFWNAAFERVWQATSSFGRNAAEERRLLFRTDLAKIVGLQLLG